LAIVLINEKCNTIENTRKYVHAETLTKPLCFPNMKYCHGNTIILKIVLIKIEKSPQKLYLL
jgi:hypothetical protein